ncbi:type II/IV secretion system protein [Candidatus Woesebacteria bacterium]|nr:type II/IV secretion system protein [Candidatus Woesebacteria bacterium]
MGIAPKLFLGKLIEKNLVDQDRANQYEIDALKKEIAIDHYLLQYTEIPSEEILKTKAELLSVPYVNIITTAIDPQSLTYISEQIAIRHNIMPYMYDEGNHRLYVASADPLNVSLLDFLEMKTGLQITMVLASESDIAKTISVAYSKNLSPEVREAIKEVVPLQPKKAETKTTTDFNNAPIAKIVNTVLEYAIKSRASDIHIEPMDIKTRVRYRIDGILQEKISLPITIHDSLVSRVKILSEMKIDEKRIPQDGRFTYQYENNAIDLRVSTLPTVNGEKIVMRLLHKTGGLPPLKTLGLHGTQLQIFEEGISKSYGIVLVTGPTGSGKTTTLYSVLSRLNTKLVNIVTLEDPVEYQIEGINQVQINPQAGLTFATGLKSFLRQDPNIILVGEIRDTETTQLAVQAALTGHLVFSTLHTNNAATTIPRLIDLGGEPFLIASVINLVIAQRIVRQVCPNCKEFIDPPQEVQESIKQELGPLLPKVYQDGQPIRLAVGRKCDECNQSGYVGRIGIFEVLPVTSAINKLILKSAPAQEIEDEARNEGMILMKQDGYLKALEGLTTIEEVIRVTEL